MVSKTFQETIIEVKEKPRLKQPVLVVGLPGIGLVSKLAADNLVRSTKAKRFASLYSPHFPNQVLALRTGRLRLFGMHFYKTRAGKHDLVILRGDLQPLTVEGQYEVCAKILEFHKSLGGTTAIAMAGYAINSLPEKPKVFCTSSSKRLLQKLLKLGGVLNANVVPIVGMAGLLPALSRLYGLKGACLLVETPGPIADANGSRTLTDLLAKMFGAKFDTSKLAGQARKASKAIQEFEKQVKSGEAAAGAPAALAASKDLTYIR